MVIQDHPDTGQYYVASEKECAWLSDQDYEVLDSYMDSPDQSVNFIEGHGYTIAIDVLLHAYQLHSFSRRFVFLLGKAAGRGATLLIVPPRHQ